MAGSCFVRESAGTRTAAPYDRHVVAQKDGIALYGVIDGVTAATGSGELADAFAAGLKQEFMNGLHRATNWPAAMNNALQGLHSKLFSARYAGKLSYSLLVTNEQDALTMHAGDCCLGTMDKLGSINWLTQPHTWANALTSRTHAEIADDPARHRLTRSFKAVRYATPDHQSLSLRSHARLILATDGFWADLTLEKQWEFLNGQVDMSSVTDDDITCLVITT